MFQQQYYADDGTWMETHQAQQHGYAFHEESSWSTDNNYGHKRFPAAMHMNKLGAFAVDSELSMSRQKHTKLGGAMRMNRLAAFAMDSDISMSKQRHGKLGRGMHMNMNMLGDFAMDSEMLMSKQKHGKLGGSSGNNIFQEGMHSDHGFGRGYAHHGGGKKLPFAANSSNSHHFSKGGGKFNSGGHHEYFSEESEEYEEAYTEEHVGAITAKVEEMRYQHHNLGGDPCYVNPYDRNNKNWWTAKGI